MRRPRATATTVTVLSLIWVVLVAACVIPIEATSGQPTPTSVLQSAKATPLGVEATAIMVSRLATAIAVQDAHLTATAQAHLTATAHQAKTPTPRPSPTTHGDWFPVPPTPAVGIGAMIQGGNWDYQVTKVERVNVIRDPVSGVEERPDGYGPNSQWLIVYLILQFRGGHEADSIIREYEFSVSDASGHKYGLPAYGRYHTRPAISSWMRSEGLVELDKQFPPGVPFRTAVFFEIHPTATRLRLCLSRETSYDPIHDGIQWPLCIALE